MPICKSCNSDSVIEDDHHGESCLVCTNCGSLVERSQNLEHETGPEVGQSYIASYDQSTTMKGRQYAYTERQTLTEARKLGFELLKNAKHVMNIPWPAYNKAVEVFKAHRANEPKVLVGACLIIGIQKNAPDIGITARQVANFCDVDTTRIMCKIKSLGENLKPTREALSLSQRLFASLECEDKEDLLDRGELLFELVRKQISVCMDPTFLAMACNFISWKSFRIHTHKKSYLKIERFFKEAGIKCQRSQLRTVQKDVQVIRNHFQTLASKLPWMEEEDIGKHDVFSLIPDVLRYCASLANDVSCENPLQSHLDPAEQIPRKVLPPEMYESELCDMDLPEEEEYIYLRSAEEVAAIEAWIRQQEHDKS